MKLKLLQVLIILYLSDRISCKGYFTIIGSNLIRQGEKYHVAVTSQDYDQDQTLEVAIRNSNKNEKKFELVQNVTLINDKTQNIEFDLKGQPIGDYHLEAKSFSDDFIKAIRLKMNTKKASVFVQTDKSIYKAADKIQFRILALDADMKPLQMANANVYITDGAQNRVKQFINVTFHKGVYQNELKLSDLPVMGIWKIHTKIDNEKEFSKEFEVAEYTLPKFEVSIDTNPDSNYKEGKIQATVKAKYTFGKIAKGNATITAEVVSNYWRRNEFTKVIKSIEVDGKKSIEFDMEKELGIKNKHRELTVKLSAAFKEELTEREMNTTATVTIHITPHKVTMKKSSDNFKPGLPFSVSAIVKYHDKDAPVTDKTNPVNFIIKYFYDVPVPCYRYSYPYDYSYYNFQRGQNYQNSPQFGVTTAPNECRNEESYEETEEIFVSNGIASLNINIPKNTTRINVEAKYLETVSSVRTNKYKFEMSQFIQLKLKTESPKLAKKVKIDVLATEELSKLTYQVLSRGDVIVSETIKVAKSKTAQIEFKPSLAMIPKSNVVVYYISSAGEIISDSVKVEFGNELENFVEVNLSKTELQPGKYIEISVHSKPNSFVGLLGVDQSVLLLKKGNDIEQSTVFSELGKYSESNRRSYDRVSNEDYNTFKDFQAADAWILTNANREKEIRKNSMNINRGGGYPIHRFGGISYDSAISYAAPSSAQSFNSGSTNRIMTTAIIPSRGDSMDEEPLHASPTVEGSKPKVIEIRKTFPETWLFESLDFNSSTTSTTLTKKVPDTITSWIITGFSVDPQTGLGLTKQPSKFNVFQPFFVSTNLPYSIKRGEVVSIPFLIFNYMDNDQEAEITLFNSEREFEFAEINESENHVRRRRSSTDPQRKKKIFVASQSGVTVNFMIRPLKVGHITIKVVAETPIAGDGVERQLLVIPEGVTQYLNKAIFIDLNTNSEFKSNFNITVPENAVPDSTRIEASAIGDILGPSIDNLDKLIKLPYGCGEQNMLNFVPNIVVLDYLTTVEKLTSEIEMKAKNYLESGYQRELTYKHEDGSYSVFGKQDDYGSTWLTAFVAKSFRQAAKYIEIDEAITEKALSFLSGVQAKDGSFPEVGRIFDRTMQGGASKGIGLTAYTLITFLESKNSENFKQTIKKALDFIVNNLESLEDNYSLAIAAYALQLAKHASKDSLLEKLMEKSVYKNEMRYWKKSVPKSDEANPWSYRPNSVNVEMTAYALQALVAAGRETDGMAVMKWLVSQRNENGGFQSTQDTVVGLTSLAKLAAKIFSPNSEIDIHLKQTGGSSKNLKIQPDNALILQKHEIPNDARDFELTAKGHGFGIFQLSYQYNLNINGEWPRFTLEPKVNSNSNKDFLHLTVCTSFVPDTLTDKSNMAVMEVSLPSGFTFDSDSLPELKATENVKKIEIEDKETKIIVYFDDLSAEKICPEFKAYRTHDVAKQKPAPIKIYDYYDSSRRASDFYNPPEISLCDICNGAEECKEDCEQMEINIV